MLLVYTHQESFLIVIFLVDKFDWRAARAQRKRGHEDASRHRECDAVRGEEILKRRLTTLAAARDPHSS